VNRVETEIALNQDRAWVLEQWLSLSPEELVTPCTVSEADPDFWWTPRDHFLHLISVEKNFRKMVSAFLSGADDALDAAVPDRPRSSEQGSMQNYVAVGNDLWIKKHRDKSMDDLVRFGESTRAQTFEVMATVADDQFAQKIPGAVWGGGTVGAMLTHPVGDHGKLHWRWVTEGLAAQKA
jgi:hypothetical protein